jgi:hypothetical protein
MSNLIKLIDTEVRILKGERRGIDSQLRGLEKARAALAPPKILTRKKAKKRKPSRRSSALSKPDKGLGKTILTMLKQQSIEGLDHPGYIGLKATDIVKVLESRGFMFTSKFPSRSVSGLLTIMHRNGEVERTPLGKPRIYHYKAAPTAPAPVERAAAQGLAAVEGR